VGNLKTENMSDSKPVLIINAVLNKENMPEVQSYLGSIGPVFVKNGGSAVARFKAVEQVTGEDGPDMIAIFEFESVETIKIMIASDDFTELADLRAKAFSTLNLTIADPM
jgi:uncharacterized protein (DUF1330 family)